VRACFRAGAVPFLASSLYCLPGAEIVCASLSSHGLAFPSAFRASDTISASERRVNGGNSEHIPMYLYAIIPVLSDRRSEIVVDKERFRHRSIKESVIAACRHQWPGEDSWSWRARTRDARWFGRFGECEACCAVEEKSWEQTDIE